MMNKSIRYRIIFPAILSFLISLSTGVIAQGFSVIFDTYVSGLTQPTTIVNASLLDDRLFITERSGTIRIVDSGGFLLATPFLDISSIVGSSGGEQGLLGLAFHPSYPVSGYFYVSYTDTSGDTVVSRFTVSGNPNLADPGSESVILTQSQPYANHNGGCIAFGQDGYLYIALGDGGSGGDPDNNAQDPATFLGKLLRIDIDGSMPYSIPMDNPFVGDPGTLDEIWAFGLRNPWRFSFDRLTDDLWIADVGQVSWEEVDLEPASSSGGLNYGWRCYEGNHEYNTAGCTGPSNYMFPIFEYDHSLGCSITGGFVYRGTEFPFLEGHYFFTDLCSGRLWSLKDDGMALAYQSYDYGVQVPGISTFGEDAQGNLYAADLYSGVVYKLNAQPDSTVPSMSLFGLLSTLILFTAGFRISRRRK
jgi:glucose/arabinose dehydrogenase